MVSIGLPSLIMVDPLQLQQPHQSNLSNFINVSAQHVPMAHTRQTHKELREEDLEVDMKLSFSCESVTQHHQQQQLIFVFQICTTFERERLNGIQHYGSTCLYTQRECIKIQAISRQFLVTFSGIQAMLINISWLGRLASQETRYLLCMCISLTKIMFNRHSNIFFF